MGRQQVVLTKRNADEGTSGEEERRKDVHALAGMRRIWRRMRIQLTNNVRERAREGYRISITCYLYFSLSAVFLSEDDGFLSQNFSSISFLVYSLPSNQFCTSKGRLTIAACLRPLEALPVCTLKGQPGWLQLYVLYYSLYYTWFFFWP